MGMVQHFVMATPAHAVVNTSVELTKKVDKAFAGLVNAVLKKAIALPPGEFRAKAVSLYFPDWVNAALSGDDKDSLAVALLEEPALDILHKPEWQPPDGFGESLLPHHLRLPKGAGRIEHLPGFAEGQWWVQDIAASLPVRLLGDLKGRTVLDACAAPGGKTAQLCSLGAQVTAVDQSRDRLQRLRQNMQRLHFDPKVIEADLLAWQPQQPFDAVLLDAPCSATGTLRRNPDIAWLREPAEIQRLVAMQRRMLARTSGWVKPGGILIYAVCSLLPEEGELQIATFLTQADFVLEPIKAGEIGNYIQWLRSDGSLRPLPNSLMEKGGMDGFYVARLRRRS
jgi:16S rRNA (cytosine967-C5)-methyltransferase